MSDERGIERPKPTIVQPPDGHAGSGFFATKVDEAIGLALPYSASNGRRSFPSSKRDQAEFGMRSKVLLTRRSCRTTT